jgi:hypothetical protein
MSCCLKRLGSSNNSPTSGCSTSSQQVSCHATLHTKTHALQGWLGDPEQQL